MTLVSTNDGVGLTNGAPATRAETARAMERPLANELGFGLQLSRANAIALTRLQLALCKGERRAALEAIDRLHALDTQVERLVAQLTLTPAEDEDWRALSSHLAEQKLALAFDKLVLASGISGPDLASRSMQLRSEESRPESSWDNSSKHEGSSSECPPLVDWHAFPATKPTVRVLLGNRLVAAVLSLVVTVMLAAAILVMASP